MIFAEAKSNDGFKVVFRRSLLRSYPVVPPVGGTVPACLCNAPQEFAGFITVDILWPPRGDLSPLRRFGFTGLAGFKLLVGVARFDFTL